MKRCKKLLELRNFSSSHPACFGKVAALRMSCTSTKNKYRGVNLQESYDLFNKNGILKKYFSNFFYITRKLWKSSWNYEQNTKLSNFPLLITINRNLTLFSCSYYQFVFHWILLPITISKPYSNFLDNVRGFARKFVISFSKLNVPL